MSEMHKEIVLFQLLPSPHQGREERYVRWWRFYRLFQVPPPEEVCRPLPVAHNPPSAHWYHPLMLEEPHNSLLLCDRNSCRIRSFSFFISSHIKSVSFLISSIISSCNLVFSWVSFLEEEDGCRSETPKYSLIPTPCPAARTRPECSGRPIASTRISWRPSATNLPSDSKESCKST